MSPFFNPKCLLSNRYNLNVPMNMLKNIVAQDMHLTLEVKSSLYDDAQNSLINCIMFDRLSDYSVLFMIKTVLFSG